MTRGEGTTMTSASERRGGGGRQAEEDLPLGGWVDRGAAAAAVREGCGWG